MSTDQLLETLREMLPEGLLGRWCPFCGGHALQLHDGREPWPVRRRGRVVARHPVPWFTCLCGAEGTALYLLHRATQARKQERLAPQALAWKQIIDQVVLPCFER
jgi:hypothetical protein